MTARQSLMEEIKSSFIEKMGDEIRLLAIQTQHDLWVGPTCQEGYPGFTTATARLCAWAADNLEEVYYCVELEEWSFSPDDDWVGVEWGYLDLTDVKKLVFGVELARYV